MFDGEGPAYDANGIMPLWVVRLNQDRCLSYDMKDPREGEQVYSFMY